MEGQLKQQSRTLRLLVALLGTLSLVAAACGPAGPTGGTPGAAEEKPVAGGRIIEGSFADIKTLQPILVADVPSSTVTGMIYKAMVNFDHKTGEPKPGMAKWETSADNLTWTWTFGDNVNWSDGKPVTAQDWETAVKAIAMSKKTVRKSSFQDIEGWKDFVDGKATTISGIKVDSANPKKMTVKFTKALCSALVNTFGSYYVLPTHIFGKYVAAGQADAIDNAPENTAPTVSSGPFKFKEWRKGDQVILERNDTYYQGKPLVDEYVFKVVADATVLAAQLKTGELNLGTVEPKDLADIEAQQNLKVFKYQALSYTYLGWNVKSQTAPALQDKRVRQALAYGLDMDAVVKSILFGQGTKMVAHHPPVSWAFPTSGMNDYKYDKAKAEELIKSAGYAKGADGMYAKEGKTLEFSVVANSGNKVRETLLQVATEQYKAIGVKLNPKLEAFETMVDKLTTGNQEIQGWIIGWSLGLEPDPYGIWHSSQIPDPAKKTTGFNFGAFTAPGFDKAIEDGRSGDCSQAARKKNYETFNKILNEEQPYNFGFSPNTLLVVPANLRAIDPATFGSTWNIEKWWFKQ